MPLSSPYLDLQHLQAGALLREEQNIQDIAALRLGVIEQQAARASASALRGETSLAA